MNDSLDRKKLVGVIAEKLNILISEEDPIFATVILNELVLTKFIDVASNELGGMLVLIKSMESSIERSTKSVVSDLNLNVEKIHKSTEHLINEGKELDLLRIKNIEAAAKSSAEFAIQDSYKRVSEIMDPMIEKVTDGLELSINALKQSFKDIQIQHSKTAVAVVNAVNKAIRKMNGERNKTVFYCMLSSAFGSAVTCGIAIGIFEWIL